MNIKTEQDMQKFAKSVKRFHLTSPFLVYTSDGSNPEEISVWEAKNQEMIQRGIIGAGSHLQQGIDWITSDSSGVRIREVPFLYPSGKLLSGYPHLTGPMTGNLSNCYDPLRKLILFHMRGTNIAAPFGFQAAAAGMGRFREHPAETAKKELVEEAGLKYAAYLFSGRAVDCLPFMKGGKIPQPLFSFGFENCLEQFPVCRSLDDVAQFEAAIKKQLTEKTIEQREGYHFTLPLKAVETIAGQLNDSKRFYGPIYESTINFLRALRDGRLV